MCCKNNELIRPPSNTNNLIYISPIPIPQSNTEAPILFCTLESGNYEPRDGEFKKRNQDGYYGLSSMGLDTNPIPIT